MGWRDNLRQGSFRGIEFFTKDVQTAAGRRAVQHQFPNREEPYSEDMGRAARVYTVQGYVLGDDYFKAKTDLLKVFEKKGPGELIHPYYGSVFVQVSEVTISESQLEGAIAVFSAKFLEAGDNRFPKGINDKTAGLAGNVAKSTLSLKDDFDNNFSIADMPSFAVDSARALVSKAQRIFNETTKTLSDSAEGIADLAFSTRNLVAEVNDLLQSPSILSQRLLDSFQLMEDAISGAKSQTIGFSAFYDFAGDVAVTGVTPIRVKEKKNEFVFENFMRRAAAVKSCDTAIVADYASFEEAEETREKIVVVLDDQIRNIEDDDGELWQDLRDVNASITEGLPDVDASLPSLKEVPIETDSHSLEVVYDLFESPDNEADIIDRNNLRHPGFIPGRSTLEVLE